MNVTINIGITAATNLDHLAQAIGYMRSIEEGCEVAATEAPEPKKDDVAAKAAAKKAAASKRRAAAKKTAEIVDDDPLGVGEDADGPTLDEVKEAVRGFIADNSVEAMKELLGEFGAKKLSELDEAKYGELVQRLAT